MKSAAAAATKSGKPAPLVDASAGREYRKKADLHLLSSTGAPQLPQLAPLLVDFRCEEPSRDGVGNAGAPDCTTVALEPPPEPAFAVKQDKVVAFQFPPAVDRRDSLCISPTWESYDQRRREKNLEKMKQKERKAEARDKESRNPRLKPKRTKLSKPQPPPPSGTFRLRLSNTNQSDSKVMEMGSTAPRLMDRPASVLGISGGIEDAVKDHTAQPQTRRRSGSFSSFIRAFDLRRGSASAEPSPDIGFIGGLKLEQERLAEQQCFIDEKVNVPEDGLHPALRPSRTSKNSSCPSLPSHSPSSPHPDKSCASKRSYPPIAMQTASSKTRSLLSPAAARATPDLSTMDKWRARVGLKLSHGRQDREPELPGIPGPYQTKNERVDKSTISLPSPHLDRSCGEASHHPVERPDPHEDLEPPRAMDMPSQRGRPAAEPFPHLPNQAQRRKNSESSGTSNEPSLKSSDFCPVSSLPPAPPRRSSKRHSILRLQGPLSPRQTQCSSSSEAETDESKRCTRKKPMTSQSERALVSSNDLLREYYTPNPWQDEAAQGLPTSSSDTSSEYFHSPSLNSTPGTSCPRSENADTPVLADAESFRLDGASREHRHETRRTNESHANGPIQLDDCGGPRGRGTAAGFDPVEEAARKVMAAFPAMAQHASTERSDGSEADIFVDAPALPCLARRPLKLRDAPEWKHDRSVSEPTLGSLAPKWQPREQWSAGRPQQAHDQAEAFHSSTPSVPHLRHTKQNSVPSKYYASIDGDMEAAPVRCENLPGASVTGAKPPSAGSEERSYDAGPIAKMFVECCACRYYHDMPSRLYEAMANPSGLVRPAQNNMTFAGAVSMTVRCPWCKHEMSTRCCAGLAAVVYVRERLH